MIKIIIYNGYNAWEDKRYWCTLQFCGKIIFFTRKYVSKYNAKRVALNWINQVKKEFIKSKKIGIDIQDNTKPFKKFEGK